MNRSRRQKHLGVRRVPGNKGILLINPVQITEDEADNIICDRRLREPTISLEEFLAEHGYKLDDRRRKDRPPRTQ